MAAADRGGGLFNHLDASFTADDESGIALPKGTTNFGGGPGLRKQLRILKDFMESFDFVRMAPIDNAIIEYSGGADCSFFLLAEEGKQYGLYIVREPNRAPCRSVTLTVPAGNYTVQWVDVFNGPLDKPKRVSVADNRLVLESPEFKRDIALRITASSKEENKP